MVKRLVARYRDEDEFLVVLVDRTDTPPDLVDLPVPVVTPTACGDLTTMVERDG